MMQSKASSARSGSFASHMIRGLHGRIALVLLLMGSGVAAFGELKAEPHGAPNPGRQNVLLAQAPPAKPAPTPAPAAPAPAAPVPTASAPASVAAPSVPEKLNGTLPAWAVSCVSKTRSAAADCKMEQRLFVKETGRLVAIAVVEVPGETRQPVLILHLPTGLALQQGASLSIDNGKATPLLWQSCDGNGCYATLAITPALLGAMKTGTSMAIKVASANREAMAFQFLLTDFAPAYQAAQ